MHQPVQYEKDSFIITTDRDRIDIDAVCGLLSKSYWASTRSREAIIKSIENSLNFSIFHGDRQVGFARIITDYTIFAYLCDVIIDEAYRGNGLGKWLIECIMQHPELVEVKRWLLATRDAHGLYIQYGFEPMSNTDKWMEYSAFRNRQV